MTDKEITDEDKDLHARMLRNVAEIVSTIAKDVYGREMAIFLCAAPVGESESVGHPCDFVTNVSDAVALRWLRETIDVIEDDGYILKPRRDPKKDN